jgi:hypothetical protein
MAKPLLNFARRVARLPGVRWIVPQSLRDRYGSVLWASSIRRLPDRQFMEKTILPTLAAGNPRHVLFVGVERYTRHYREFFDRSCEYWTLDKRAAVVPFGAGRRHVTADFLEAPSHFSDGMFDVVIFNGLFGFGLDMPDAQAASVRVLARLVHAGGYVLLGWNKDRSADPLALSPMSELFEPMALQPIPSRQEFDSVTHVYDMVRRR